MPIQAITSSQLTVRCAACSCERVVLAKELVLGVPGCVDAIRLPPCACGAQELLVRTWDRCPVALFSTFFAQHRRRVNGLAEALRSDGAIDPSCAALQHTVPRHPPPDCEELEA